MDPSVTEKEFSDPIQVKLQVISNDACSLQKQHHKHQGRYKSDHHDKQAFSVESLAILGYLRNDLLTADDPSYQDTCKDRYNGHHHIIA